MSNYYQQAIDEANSYSDHYNKVDFLQERYAFAMQKFNETQYMHWKVNAQMIQMRINDLEFEYSAQLATEAARAELFAPDYDSRDEDGIDYQNWNDFGPGDPDMTDIKSPYFFLNQ